MTWLVYLLECADGTYYAGITNRLEHRLEAHNSGQGARYTRSRRPVALLATQEHPDRSAASKAELRLKRLPRSEKLAFFEAEIAAKTGHSESEQPMSQQYNIAITKPII